MEVACGRFCVRLSRHKRLVHANRLAMKSLVLALCLVPWLVACGGVKGVDQATDAELGRYSGAAALPAGAAKSEALMIGTKDAHELIPALLEWEVAKDEKGCLRIKQASLKRTGGPSSAEVYDVKFTPPKDGACGSRLSGKEETFEIVQVSYCWRWNGASNTAACAYSGGVTLNADQVGVESMDKAKAPPSSSAR